MDEAGAAAPVDDPGLAPDGVPHPAVGEVAELPPLGDVGPAVGMDGGAAGGVRQGVEGAAVDDAVGVAAVGHRRQAQDRAVLLGGLQLNVVVDGEGVGIGPGLHPLEKFVHRSRSFAPFGRNEITVRYFTTAFAIFPGFFAFFCIPAGLSPGTAAAGQKFFSQRA